MAQIGRERRVLISTGAMLALWTVYALVLHPRVVTFVCVDTLPNGFFPQIVGKILVHWSVLLAFLWSLPRLPKPRLRGALALLLWLSAIVVAMDMTLYELLDARRLLDLITSDMGWASLSLFAALYMVLLALPFVPGVELGLLLMLIFGRSGIVVVYLATVAGLTLAYCLGRFAPATLYQKLRSRLAEQMPERLVGEQGPLGRLKGLSRGRLGRWITASRALLLALLINLPGNAVIGGGGGISMIYGIGRLVTLRTFLLVVLLATAPVPLLAFFGLVQVDRLLAGSATQPPPIVAQQAFPYGSYEFPDFTVTFAADGGYRVMRQGALVIEGEIEIEGPYFAVTHSRGALACMESVRRGEYWWVMQAGEVTFRRIRDYCRNRADLMDRARLDAASGRGGL
jgi:hypothetical protein